MTPSDRTPDGVPVSRRDLLRSLGATGILGGATAGAGAPDAGDGSGDRRDGMGEAAVSAGSRGGATATGSAVPRSPTGRVSVPDGVRFGAAVGMDGDRAVVGAPPGVDQTTGSASIFAPAGETWRPRATLEPAEPAHGGFGAAVAVDGDTALVGAPLPAGPGRHEGTVTAFESADGDWHRAAILALADGAGVDRFGAAVALDGDTALVGAPAAGPTGSAKGIAVAFDRSGGEWTREATLRPAADGASEFGTTVALDGDTALVGAPAAGPAGRDAGVAAAFTRTASGWTHEATLARDGAARDRFGAAVALDGGAALVGAPTAADGVPAGDAAGTTGAVGSGGASLFTRSGTGWSLDAELAGSGHSGDRFGAAVALGGGAALVGSRFGPDFGGTTGTSDAPGEAPPAGVVHAFARDGWERRATLGPREAGGRFGATLALDGARALVGAPGAAGPDDSVAGLAEVFEPWP